LEASGYILVDESFQQQVVKELAELKAILLNTITRDVIDLNKQELIDMSMFKNI
jgi:hypothetical protein